jgi:hypothetical protein
VHELLQHLAQREPLDLRASAERAAELLAELPAAAPRLSRAGRRIDSNRESDMEDGVAVDADPGRRRFALVGAILFFAIGLLRAWYHEPRACECGTWLVATGCLTPAALVDHLRYTGHPYLWPGLAWLLACATDSIFSLQCLQLLIATTTAWLVLRFAPWPPWEAVAVVLGYYFFFEYGILCRSYGLGMLGAVLVAYAWGRSADRAWAGGVGILLLTQSSFFGVLLAVALALPLVVAAAVRARTGELTASWLAGWLLPLVGGTALTLAQVLPPPDSGYYVKWHLQPDAVRAGRTLGSAFLGLAPLPNLSSGFPYPWNSTLLNGMRARWMGAAGAAALLLACLALWSRPRITPASGGIYSRRNEPGGSPKREVVSGWLVSQRFVPLLIFLGGTSAVLAFEYVKYPGWMRHHGHNYLAFLVAAWIAARNCRPGWAACWSRRVIFGAQMTAGLLLAASDWFAPFSTNRAAAEWIQTHPFRDHVLVGHPPHPAAGVAMYLRQPIFRLTDGRWGTFNRWDNRVRRIVDPVAICEAARAVARVEGRAVLLIANRRLPDGQGLRLCQAFEDCVNADERFYLYETEAEADSLPSTSGTASRPTTSTAPARATCASGTSSH